MMNVILMLTDIYFLHKNVFQLFSFFPSVYYISG